jgi:hypothetical protein
MIDRSTFGSELVAAKVATKTVRGPRYKLQMLGVPIDGPTYFFGDNMSVVTNISIPESVLKKKSNSIACRLHPRSRRYGRNSTCLCEHEAEHF